MRKSTTLIVAAMVLGFIAGWIVGEQTMQRQRNAGLAPSNWMGWMTGFYLAGLIGGSGFFIRDFLVPRTKAGGVTFWIRLLAGTAFGATLLFAPFQSERINSTLKTKTYTTTTAPIWSGPSYPLGAKHTLQLDRLLIMWAAIGICYYLSNKLLNPKQ
ncbi:MAG: hypothetical protein K0Q55_2382 [Verrucomicrobia bacterium]|jgi:hypothetical protein|nr:hypothetical protein [Verrucomicrobiota bacterium]